MARKQQVRYQLFLPQAQAEAFERLAAGPGASKSAILSAALAAFISRRGASEAEDRFARRLDNMSSQLGRLERNGDIALETLALFVRYMLSVNAPLAEEDEEARAVGRERFSAFIERVGRQVASGRRTFARESE